MESNYADAYKLKSGTIDKRLMRVQRRSIDWKSKRQDLLQKRRNMSPLAESFQNSSTMSFTTGKPAMNTPFKKKAEDTENSIKGKTSAKTKSKESDDLKARLSKWKLEKEAKKKLEALEKAKKQTFKVGKLEHKDNGLFNVGQSLNSRKLKVVEPPIESKQKVTGPKSAVRNLKRKGDDLHSSTSKRQVSDTNNVKTSSTSRSVKQKAPEREIKKTKTTPSKRITRRTKIVESRLFAATASTAAKTVAPPKNTKPAVEKRATRSATAAPEKKKKPAKTQPSVAAMIPSSVSSPEKDIAKEIQSEKVNLSRGNAYFPEEFSFTAPANLKSYTFNPLSPDSSANFFLTKDTTMSFSIDSCEGRCSTPTPRQNNVKENNDQTKQGDENISVTVKQDVQEHKDTASEDDDNTKSADESGNRTTLENTILERTVTVGADDNDIKVTVTPQKVTSSDEENKIVKAGGGVRKSSRLASFNDSVSTDSQAEVKINSPAPGRRRSLRNRPLDISTSESSEGETDRKNKTPRTRRSLRKSVHTQKLEDHSLPIISEASSQINNAEEEDESILSETLLSKSISNYEDSVFVRNEPKPEKKVEKVLPESSSEDNEKVSTSVSMIESNIATPKAIRPETTKRLSKSAERSGTVQDDGFRTPGAPMSAQRRTRRKTVGSSTPSQARSPEEWVKILAKSPMIEMNRRTPKSKKSPAENRIEQPNFDDVDEILNNSLQVEPDSTTTSETEIVHTANDTHSVDVLNAEETPTSVSIKDNCGAELDVAAEAMAGSAKIDEQDSKDNGSRADTGSDDNKTDGIVEEPMEVDATSSDDNTTVESGEHDVKYFRNLIMSESAKLSTSNIEWNTYLQQNKNLTEEVDGSIRTVVGQSQLLMDQRFKQFTGLIDDCEFNTGEKETKCEDLQGFWDMIYYQVEDVHKKFEDLDQRKDKNWVVEEKKVIKKVMKKKVTKTAKPAAKSKFAAFRAEMLKNKEAEATDKKLSPQMAAVKTFDAGFFKVNSPVKKSPHFHCEGGTPRKSKPQTEHKQCDEHDQKDDTEQMDTQETKSVDKEDLKPTENKELENNEANGEATAENIDDTTDSKSENSKRLPLSVLTSSGHNMRTPRRKSYAPNVPSPLLQDITPKLKTRRSLAANMAAQAIDAIDVCPLTSSDTFMTTPKSTGRSKRGTPKITEDATPRRRSLRVRKSVCFNETPSNKTEPIVETDDLSLFLQPTVHVSSPVSDNTLLLDEDSPFTLKHFEEAHSAKKSTRASSRRKSTKRSPSDEKRRRSTRRSVHFDKSPACTQVKSGVDDLLFTPPSQQGISTPTSKSRPSLLFTPPGKENTSIDTDNLISFTP